MQHDITEVLDDWEYDPENNIRIIQAADGREVLQLREPLGVEQYELDGRPDRQRPFGKESILDEYLERLEAATASGEGIYKITHEDFEMLQYEGIIYYYRYLLLYQMGQFSRTVRDTEHNLKICEVVEKYAEDEEDKKDILQYKPYILRMNAISHAMLALNHHKKTEAEEILEGAIEDIEAMADIATTSFHLEKVRSLNYLKDALRQVREKDSSPVEGLKEELRKAVEDENYERAAQLRDQIVNFQENT